MISKNIFFQHLCGAILAVSFASLVPAKEVLLDEVVASINDEVIMSSELEDRALEVLDRIRESDRAGPPQDEVIAEVLERLIIERIQLLKAKQAGVRFSDTEVNQAIEQAAQRQNKTMQDLLDEGQQSGVTAATFRQKVREQMLIGRVQEGNLNKRISISEQAIDNFLNTEEGRSWATPDFQIGHILLPVASESSDEEVAKIQEEILSIYFQIKNGEDFKSLAIAKSKGNKASQGGDLGWKKASELPDIFSATIENLSPGQISEPIRSAAGFHLLKLYNRRGIASSNLVQQHNIRHILLVPNEIRDDEKTLEIANKIRNQILNGKNFDDVARTHSEDIGTAMSGGSLGWSVPGKFVAEFEKTMNALNINEISEVIKTQFGWHILQVTERRDQDFTDTIKRSQAKNTLKQKRYREELEVWLKEIRDEAFVDIKL